MMQRGTIRTRGRLFIALALIMQVAIFNAAIPSVVAADVPFAGDDTFQVGATTVTDPTTVSVTVDRAYGPLADDAGHLRSDLIGTSVAADSTIEVSPTDGVLPIFAVAINNVPVSTSWQSTAAGSTVYRVTVSTTAVLFPAPGDVDHALAPRANAITLSGVTTSLNWLRLVVPGAPPALLMAGADFSCNPPGITDPTETWNDWGRWLTADGVPYVAPARDGHVTIAEQLPALDTGYAALRRMYGPNRPGLSPRVTLVGYSMGGLVARLWASQRPGIVNQFLAIASPDAGSEAATNFFTAFISRCSGGALHDLTPDFLATFNKTVDLSHYWDPDSAAMHITTIVGVPATGEPTDGLVSELSADTLAYATHLTWTPDSAIRAMSLHLAIPHAEKVYTDLRDRTHFTSPIRDGRTGF